MVFREDAPRARHAGLAAARAGRPATACFRFNDSQLTAAWVRGYASDDQSSQSSRSSYLAFGGGGPTRNM
ncbi:hypothetical protein GCM10017674_66420 [Streptomyces gardneri]|uniref:Uncharacterized protein n=1 Tax=Streptomyces gardneri TaxID=66892 RepID=A0A4Y3RHJ1_9ACTN|nr:hypothetical protein SGA01_27200 [Streptomyces gardneri]GHH16468.1 hypothetical protein GCM10017674_66420 [Streptomyces gardneri]